MTSPAPGSQHSAPANTYAPPADDPITQLVAAFIGTRWESHYSKAWQKFGSPAGLRPGTSWNWPAGLFSFYWLLYRRQYLYAVAYFVGSGILNLVPFGFFAWLASIVLMGMYGDRIILDQAYKAADKALKLHGPGEQARADAAAAGGTSWLFLLVLIIPFVLIIGILAAIAIPKFAQVKQRAYESVMRSDLRNLATIEDSAFAVGSRYTGNLGSFVPTNGVTTPEITLTSDSTGYIATVTHSQVPGKTCALAVNLRNPVDSTAASGQPACR
jgi:Tfp pilus assembly protein PilE